MAIKHSRAAPFVPLSTFVKRIGPPKTRSIASRRKGDASIQDKLLAALHLQVTMKAITAPTIVALLLAIARTAHLGEAGKQNIAPAAVAESLKGEAPTSTPPATAVPKKETTTIRELPIDPSQILKEPDTVLFGGEKGKPAPEPPASKEAVPAKPSREAIEKSLSEEPLVTPPPASPPLKEAAKVEAVKEPKKAEPAPQEPKKEEPKKVEPVPEPKKEEPKKVESVPEPKKVEPVAPELKKEEPKKEEPHAATGEAAEKTKEAPPAKEAEAKPLVPAEKEKPRTSRLAPPAITSYRKGTEEPDKKAYLAFMEHLLAKDYASNIPAFSVEHAGHVRLVTFNTHLLQKLASEPTSAGDTTELAIHILRSLSPSIVHLQEVPSIKGSGDQSKYDFGRFLQRLHDELGLKHVVHCDTAQLSSLVIASRFPLANSTMFLNDINKDCFAIRSHVTIEAEGFEPTRMQLVNAHLDKNVSRTAEQVEHIAKALEVSKDKQQFLMAADFNQPMPSGTVKPLKDRCAMRDVFKLIGWHPPTLSCWADVRVDGILASRTLADAILGAYFRPTTASDHMPGIVDIDLRKVAAKKSAVPAAPSGAASGAAAAKAAAEKEAAAKAKTAPASKSQFIYAEGLAGFSGKPSSSATGSGGKSRWWWPIKVSKKERKKEPEKGK